MLSFYDIVFVLFELLNAVKILADNENKNKKLYMLSILFKIENRRLSFFFSVHFGPGFWGVLAAAIFSRTYGAAYQTKVNGTYEETPYLVSINTSVLYISIQNKNELRIIETGNVSKRQLND